MDKDLKSCPFCGGEANFCYLVSKDNPMEYGVSCASCSASKRWYSSSQTALEAWNTRATDCTAVDVDALKREVFVNMGNGNVGECEHSHGWNDCINHLASRNVFRGAVEPIEGLEEAINRTESDEDKGVMLGDIDIFYKAAKKYHEMTKEGK